MKASAQFAEQPRATLDIESSWGFVKGGDSYTLTLRTARQNKSLESSYGGQFVRRSGKRFYITMSRQELQELLTHLTDCLAATEPEKQTR